MKQQYHSKYVRDRQLTRNTYDEWGWERRTYPDGNKLRLAALSFQKRGFRVDLLGPAYTYTNLGTYTLGVSDGNYQLTVYFHLDEKGKRVP